MTIFKICDRELWNDSLKKKVFRGAPVDLQDGFIHFSTDLQVKETAARHFANMSDLVLVEFDEAQFGERLKWEVSRGGDRFPHLYGTFDPADAVAVYELPLRDDGVHQFPTNIR